MHCGYRYGQSTSIALECFHASVAGYKAARYIDGGILTYAEKQSKGAKYETIYG